MGTHMCDEYEMSILSVSWVLACAMLTVQFEA